MKFLKNYILHLYKNLCKDLEIVVRTKDFIGGFFILIISYLELAVQEEKQELLNQIAMLRTYISVLENRLETPKFGQLQLPRKLYSKAATTRGVLDVEMILRRDLYRFSGMQCVKCNGSFVFEMFSTNHVSSNDTYAVEILIDDDGRGKLGKWILPMAVDVQNIMSRHPIDDLNNIKQFLRRCKYHVDCYICRAKQLEELRVCLNFALFA